jgi:hypothetical protein
MAVSIDTSSIRLAVHVKDVKPRLGLLNVPFVLGGVSFRDAAQFDLTPAADSPVPLIGGLRVEATVNFSMGPRDTLDVWQVGFMQIARINNCMTIYAGRTSGEGSILCDALSALLPNNAILDCKDQTTIPWAVPPDGKSAFKGNVASPHFGDNPNLHLPQHMENRKVSNLNNFLLRFQWDIDFWTILAAIGPDQSRRNLAHFHWRVAHDVGCFWRGGIPHPSEGPGASFKLIDKFVSGPPKDADLQAILANPAGPIANDVAKKAFDNSIVGIDPRSRQELDTWFFSAAELRFFGLPGQFWT